MTDPETSDVDTALDRRVDPVAEADEYRNVLLGLLGGRDPAAIQAELPRQLEAMIEQAGPHLRTRPASGEWSVPDGRPRLVPPRPDAPNARSGHGVLRQ